MTSDGIIFNNDLDTEPDIIDSLRQELKMVYVSLDTASDFLVRSAQEIARLTAEHDDWMKIVTLESATLKAKCGQYRVALSDLLFQISCAQNETHVGICTEQAEKALEETK